MLNALRRVSAFSFTVRMGEERHEIEWRCDQFNGRIVARVDGRPVFRSRLPHVGFSRTRRFEFAIGDAERHTVTVEMTRTRLLAGLRPLSYRFLIDGRLVTSVER